MTEVAEQTVASPAAVIRPDIQPVMQPEIHGTTLGRWVIGGCREMVPGDMLAGSTYQQAKRQAMADVFRDIKADPEAVFRGILPADG